MNTGAISTACWVPSDPHETLYLPRAECCVPSVCVCVCVTCIERRSPMMSGLPFTKIEAKRKNNENETKSEIHKLQR